MHFFAGPQARIDVAELTRQVFGHDRRSKTSLPVLNNTLDSLDTLCLSVHVSRRTTTNG